MFSISLGRKAVNFFFLQINFLPLKLLRNKTVCNTNTLHDKIMFKSKNQCNAMPTKIYSDIISNLK